jgi:hypothetical protein
MLGQIDVDVVSLPIIKDAWVDVGPCACVRVTAGQFKKPWSRLELLSSGKLPLVTRGLVNERFADSGFGGRDVGAMLHGQPGAFGYALGVFNGTGSAAAPETDKSKDAAARVTYELGDALEVGAAGSMIDRQPILATVPGVRVFAAEVDARLKLGPVDALLEAVWAQEPVPKAVRREQAGAVGYAVFRTPRVRGVSVRPLFKVEVVDDDTSRSGGLAWGLLGGLNLDFKGPLRLMLQVEQVLPQEKSSFGPKQTTYYVQLALDSKVGLRTVEE